MSDDPESLLLITSPATWTNVFMLASYVMAIGCLYYGIKKGLPKGWPSAVTQVIIFGFFALSVWFLESWAFYRTPYYVYSPVFRDLLPRFDYTRHPFLVSLLGPAKGACHDFVTRVMTHNHADGIPLSVVLVEASLTYAALCAAELVGAKILVGPFLGGVLLLDVDLLLDPVVSQSHDCAGNAWKEQMSGMGLWHWFLPTPTAPGQTDGRNPLAAWFGVPLFNFAAWLAAPVLLIALVHVGAFVRDLLALVFTSRVPHTKPVVARVLQIEKKIGVSLVLLAGLVLVVFRIAPNADPSPLLQTVLLVGLAVIAVIVVLTQLRQFRSDNATAPTLTRPALLMLLIPALAGIFNGQFVRQPWLMPLAVVAVGLGLWIAWLPFGSALRGFGDRVSNIDRFTRLHYFGFPAMLTLSGAGMFPFRPCNLILGGLLVVALSFHVFAYVHNDVVDFEVDQKQPLRQKDPLVLGTMSRTTAAAVAFVAMFLGFLVMFHMTRFTPSKSPWAFAALGAAFLLMIAYNLWGKKCAVPPLTDLVQAVSWALLSLVGSLIVAREETLSVVWSRTAPFFVYGAGFIFLINGIHGGLRDLSTDRDCKRITTAIFLGGETEGGADAPSVVSNARIAAFAHGVHAVMFAAAAWFIADNPDAFGANRALAVAVLALCFVVSAWVLHRVVRPREPHRNEYLSWHLFVLLVPPVALFLTAEGPATVIKVLLVCSFFFPLLLQSRILEPFIRYASRIDQPDTAGAESLLRSDLPPDLVLEHQPRQSFLRRSGQVGQVGQLGQNETEPEPTGQPSSAA